MLLLASLSAFGYYSGCVDCRLSPVACDVLSVLVSYLLHKQKSIKEKKQAG